MAYILYLNGWDLLVSKHHPYNPGNQDAIGTEYGKKNLEIEVTGEKGQPVFFRHRRGKKDGKQDPRQGKIDNDNVYQLHCCNEQSR